MTAMRESAPLMLIAGSSGVVGRHLIAKALEQGFRVRCLVRDTARRDADHRIEVVEWDPKKAGAAYPSFVERIRVSMESAAVVVNLAGASLAEGRLDEAHRQRVLQSRLSATSALVMASGLCQKPPRVWLQASAVGYYGDTGDDAIDEDAPRGSLFLSEVCAKWENATRAIVEQKSPPRIVIARIGLVLAKDAPAWNKMLTPIRFGAGGALGTGRQWYSWIDADDLADALMHFYRNPRSLGVYNLTAPEPVRQIDLARAAAKILRRPAVLPAPAFALRAAVGSVADELLLPSCRAIPKRLLAENFPFRFPTISDELMELLKS